MTPSGVRLSECCGAAAPTFNHPPPLFDDCADCGNPCDFDAQLCPTCLAQERIDAEADRRNDEVDQ